MTKMRGENVHKDGNLKIQSTQLGSWDWVTFIILHISCLRTSGRRLELRPVAELP